LLVRSLSPLYISLKSTDNSSLIQFLPTRRSSDLPAASATRSSTPRPYNRAATTPAATAADSGLLLRAGPGRARQADASPGPAARLEEHTSELQSRENLVCRHLLEKKKKPNTIISN